MPLHTAVMNNRSAVVTYLCSHTGVDVNAIDPFGKRAIDFAHDIEIINILLAHSATISLMTRSVDCLAYLCSRPGFDPDNTIKNKRLFKIDRNEELQCLVDHGADINSTALTHELKHPCEHITTPLFHAQWQNLPLFYASSADPEILNGRGLNVLQNNWDDPAEYYGGGLPAIVPYHISRLSVRCDFFIEESGLSFCKGEQDVPLDLRYLMSGRKNRQHKKKSRW